MATKKKLKVTAIRSPNKRGEKQRATYIGLGLRRLHSSKVLEDTPAVRGMINKVKHLVTVEEIA